MVTLVAAIILIVAGLVWLGFQLEFIWKLPAGTPNPPTRRNLYAASAVLAVITTIVAIVSGVRSSGINGEPLVELACVALGIGVVILLFLVLYDRPQWLITRFSTQPLIAKRRLIGMCAAVIAVAFIAAITVWRVPFNEGWRPVLTALLVAAIVLMAIEVISVLNKGAAGTTVLARYQKLTTGYQILSWTMLLLLVVIIIAWATLILGNFNWNFLKFWEWQWYIWLILAFVSFVICAIAGFNTDFQAFMFWVGVAFLVGLAVDLVLSYSVAATVIALLIIAGVAVIGFSKFGWMGAVLGGLATLILLTAIFWTASIWVWPISMTSMTPPTIGKWVSTWSASPTAASTPFAVTHVGGMPDNLGGSNGPYSPSTSTTSSPSSDPLLPLEQQLGLHEWSNDGTPNLALVFPSVNPVKYPQKLPDGYAAVAVKGNTAIPYRAGDLVQVPSNGWWLKIVDAHLLGALCDAELNLHHRDVLDMDRCPASAVQPVTYGTLFSITGQSPQSGVVVLQSNVLGMKEHHTVTITAPNGDKVVVLSVVNNNVQMSLVPSGHSVVASTGSSIILAQNNVSNAQLMLLVANNWSALTS